MRKTASSGTSRGAGTPAHHTTAATSPVTAPSPWIAVAVIGWRAQIARYCSACTAIPTAIAAWPAMTGTGVSARIVPAASSAGAA
ncbi:hypothetical protein [Microbacterium lacticum]